MTTKNLGASSSRRPKNCADRTPEEIEEIVQFLRLRLYNKYEMLYTPNATRDGRREP